MIKINVNKIKDWDTIKECHKQYFLEKVKKEIKKVSIHNDDSKKYLLLKYLFLDDDNIIDENKLFKIAIGTRKDLDEIICNYNNIVFLNENEKFKYGLINSFIDTKCRTTKTILESLDKMYLQKKSKEQENFYNEFHNEINKNNKNITKKEDRKEMVLKSELGNIFKEIYDIKGILEKIFDYEKCFGKEGIQLKNNIRWNRHKLLSMMGVSVCPYCNRQYINNYMNIKKQDYNSTADLDHFYPKSTYPFLALSLCNFIPSCQICNSRFKLDKNFYEEQYIYPYEEEFGEEVKFKTNFYVDTNNQEDSGNESKNKETYDISYLLGNSDNFKIEIKPENPESEIGKKIDNSIKTFRLEELYNFHKDYVRELIKKAIIYNESRIDELYTQYPELFSSRNEVVQMVVSNYISDEELGKRPLSKLTKDICEELGLR